MLILYALSLCSFDIQYSPTIPRFYVCLFFFFLFFLHIIYIYIYSFLFLCINFYITGDDDIIIFPGADPPYQKWDKTMFKLLNGGIGSIKEAISFGKCANYKGLIEFAAGLTCYLPWYSKFSVMQSLEPCAFPLLIKTFSFQLIRLIIRISHCLITLLFFTQGWRCIGSNPNSSMG